MRHPAVIIPALAISISGLITAGIAAVAPSRATGDTCAMDLPNEPPPLTGYPTIPAGCRTDVSIQDQLRQQILDERAQHRTEVRKAYRAGFKAGRIRFVAKPTVQEAISLASVTFGVPRSTLSRIAFCESRFSPTAHNPSGASGLFQFMPGTWAGNRYGQFSVWSAYANALGAAYHMSRYGTGAWVCR